MGRLAPWDGRTGHAWWAVSLQTLLPDTGHMPRAPASLLTVPRLCLPADVATRGGASFWLLVVHAQSLQLCLSLCNPMDLSPLGFPGGTSGKEPACSARDIGDSGSIPELGRSPGGGQGIPLQYSCLENPKDIEAWQAIVHKVAKSRT